MRSKQIWLLCSLVLWGLGGEQSSVWALEEGSLLPELKTQALEGSLPDIKGKVLLLDFWASWCGPCKQSFPELEKIYSEYKSRGVVVLAVNEDDDVSAMKVFLEKNKVSFPVVRDREHSLISKVGAESMPTSLLIDGMGRVRHIHTGFRGEETVLQIKSELDALLKATKE